VQVVSTSNVIYYLFKYILKGLDKNKGQVVVDGDRARGTQAGASTRTHNRREPRDEIAIWRDLREVRVPHPPEPLCAKYSKCSPLTSPEASLPKMATARPHQPWDPSLPKMASAHPHQPWAPLSQT
jgi:hypothetical protein